MNRFVTATRAATLVILVLMCGLAVGGTVESGLDWLGGAALRAENDRYLTVAFNKAVAGFSGMSVIKAGLDIIEGSSVEAGFGVSARIEAGDLVQPAYDYVDIAWHTLLVGSVALLGIKYLLAAAGMVDGYVLLFTLMMATAYMIVSWGMPGFNRIRRFIGDVLGIGAISMVALYFLLPLSVWGAAQLSAVITAPGIAAAEKGFQQTRETLFPEEQKPHEGWIQKIRKVPERIEQIAAYLKQRSTEMIVWAVQLITGYVFDCIVFPVTLFLMLLWLTRAAMRYLFQYSLIRSLKQDLSASLTSRA